MTVKRLTAYQQHNNRININILIAVALYVAAASAAAAIVVAKNVVVRNYDSAGKIIFMLQAEREQRKSSSLKKAFLGVDAQSRARLQYYNGTLQQGRQIFKFERAEWGAGEIRLYGVSGTLTGDAFFAREAHYQIIFHRWLFNNISYRYPDKEITRARVEYLPPSQ